MSKNTIIYNSDSWDGIFCREIALKALEGIANCNVIQWRPGSPNVRFPTEGHIYVLGMPLDAPFGSQEPHDCESNWHRLTWVHNHPDAIRNTDAGVPGLRISGVANCRLAYAHFFSQEGPPTKEDFYFGLVEEPSCLTLVQDKTKDPAGLTAAFFRGLTRLQRQPDWDRLLTEDVDIGRPYIQALVQLGRVVPDPCAQQGEPAERPRDLMPKGPPDSIPACAVCGSKTAALVQNDYAKEPRWVCLGGCKHESWGIGGATVQTCPIVMDTWPIKDEAPAKPQRCDDCGSTTSHLTNINDEKEPCWVCAAGCRRTEPARSVGTTDSSKLQGCGQGVCAICGSTSSPLHAVDYADEPLWICLGGCKRKENADELRLSKALLQQVGDHFEAHLENGGWHFRRLAERQQTVDEVVSYQHQWIKSSPLYAELIRWLDQRHITSDSIGSIRRRVLLPWASEWNEIVRQETKAREHSLT
jgi:hypothetical protein